MDGMSKEKSDGRQGQKDKGRMVGGDYEGPSLQATQRIWDFILSKLGSPFEGTGQMSNII